MSNISDHQNNSAQQRGRRYLMKVTDINTTDRDQAIKSIETVIEEAGACVTRQVCDEHCRCMLQQCLERHDLKAFEMMLRKQMNDLAPLGVPSDKLNLLVDALDFINEVKSRTWSFVHQARWEFFLNLARENARRVLH